MLMFGLVLRCEEWHDGKVFFDVINVLNININNISSNKILR
jgi:hypothetical protein